MYIKICWFQTKYTKYNFTKGLKVIEWKRKQYANKQKYISILILYQVYSAARNILRDRHFLVLKEIIHKEDAVSSKIIYWQ